jgi:hypothetical protein
MGGQGDPKTTLIPYATIMIDGGPDTGLHYTKFEWASFVNGGYIIRAQIQDPYGNSLQKLATDQYLADGRRKETEVKFKIEWTGGSLSTAVHTAFITDLSTKGSSQYQELQFVAIDKPSFFLQEGTADGKAYTGNVTQVIKQVVKDFAPKIGIDITQTNDNKQNTWYMMRQDPKTFILSLLDWSSSVTPQRTQWIVSSVDDKLFVKEQAEIPTDDFGIYYVNRPGATAVDALEFEMLADNMLTPLQTKMITSGISAVSGQYLDKITDTAEVQVIVTDKNTSAKVNVDITELQGFKKPDKPWATSIMAIPEHSAGDVGLTYDKYIDGRARKTYLDMLRLVMRMRLRVFGDPKLQDSSKLGVATCTVNWASLDGEPYFLSGKWLIYGWHHVVTVDNWYTDLYLSRIDYDADAKKL